MTLRFDSLLICKSFMSNEISSQSQGVCIMNEARLDETRRDELRLGHVPLPHEKELAIFKKRTNKGGLIMSVPEK